jgi:hypothetical protein
MSSAGLFAWADPDGPTLVWLPARVIVVDIPGFGEGRLTALPARRLLDDPEFVRRLAADGGPAGSESVELAGLHARLGGAPALRTPAPAAARRRRDGRPARPGPAACRVRQLVPVRGGQRGAAAGRAGRAEQDRFARALCARMRTAGWVAGPARPGGQAAVGRLAASARQVLVVVDYAETPHRPGEWTTREGPPGRHADVAASMIRGVRTVCAVAGSPTRSI